MSHNNAQSSSASASSSSTSSAITSTHPPIELGKGINGLDKIILREPRGSSAEVKKDNVVSLPNFFIPVYLYGGFVTSWKNEHGDEFLFFSKKANFKPPKVIHGGIPICFPQFSDIGNLVPHGFARNKIWSLDCDSRLPAPKSCKSFIDLILVSSENERQFWPHDYEFRLRVALRQGGALELTSRIRNINKDGKPFKFTFAYHTYFSISDISEVRIEGLETMDYLDNLKNRERFTDQGNAITFESEVDNIYLSTPNKIAILDHQTLRTYVIHKGGLPDTVVWNPWNKKAKALADFGNDEYNRMVCVEAAAIENEITLKPGEEWKGKMELSVVYSC